MAVFQEISTWVRIGHAASPFCPEYVDVEESPENVIFECSRFVVKHGEMTVICDTGISADNIVARRSYSWNAVNAAVIKIMSFLQRK